MAGVTGRIDVLQWRNVCLAEPVPLERLSEEETGRDTKL